MSCFTCQKRQAAMYTRALDCADCVRRRGGNPARDAACPVDRVPIKVHVLGHIPCPIGRHGDRDGIRTVLGVRFHGPPIWRLWSYWRRYAPRGQSWSDFRRKVDGCGCSVVLKRWWGAICSRIR